MPESAAGEFVIRPVSAAEALAASLRERILRGEIGPGEVLPEESVASLYGVGRPTVRAVIQQLVFEGLLRRQRNRSAYVPELTSEEVRDLFFVRTPLELHTVATLAERAIRPTAAARALEHMEALDSESSWADVVDAALGFHRALVEAVESPRLRRLHRSLEAEVRLCFAQLKRRHGGLPAHRPIEHRKILDAVLAHDSKLATRLMREHLDDAVRLLTP